MSSICCTVHYMVHSLSIHVHKMQIRQYDWHWGQILIVTTFVFSVFVLDFKVKIGLFTTTNLSWHVVFGLPICLSWHVVFGLPICLATWCSDYQSVFQRSVRSSFLRVMSNGKPDQDTEANSKLEPNLPKSPIQFSETSVSFGVSYLGNDHVMFCRLLNHVT